MDQTQTRTGENKEEMFQDTDCYKYVLEMIPWQQNTKNLLHNKGNYQKTENGTKHLQTIFLAKDLEPECVRNPNSTIAKNNNPLLKK